MSKQLIGDDVTIIEKFSAVGGGGGDGEEAETVAAIDDTPIKDPADSIPHSADYGSVPAIEWWDEAFLPRDMREARKRAMKPVMPLSSCSNSSSSSSSEMNTGFIGSIDEFYGKAVISNAKSHM